MHSIRIECILVFYSTIDHTFHSIPELRKRKKERICMGLCPTVEKLLVPTKAVFLCWTGQIF